MPSKKYNELHFLIKNVFFPEGIKTYLTYLNKRRLINLLEDISLESNEILMNVDENEFYSLLNFVKVAAEDANILRVNKREIVSNFLRIFHVLFTSVIGISLGLSTYIILGMSFEAASTLFIGMNAVLLGSLAGFGFVKSMQYDSDALRKKIQLNKLRVMVSDVILMNIENDITRSCESIDDMFTRLAKENAITVKQPNALMNFSKYDIRRFEYKLDLIRKDLKDEFIRKVSHLAAISREIQSQGNFISSLDSDDHSNKLPSLNVSDNREAPHRGFWNWFKNNKSYVLSNAAGVTLGNFSGYFVVPGILLLIGKSMAFYTMVGILLGPVGLLATVGIISLLTVLNTIFFVYTQYRNSVRSDFLEKTNCDVIKNSNLISEKNSLLLNMIRFESCLSEIYRILKISSNDEISFRPAPPYLPGRSVIEQHRFIGTRHSSPALNIDRTQVDNSFSPSKRF